MARFLIFSASGERPPYDNLVDGTYTYTDSMTDHVEEHLATTPEEHKDEIRKSWQEERVSFFSKGSNYRTVEHEVGTTYVHGRIYRDQTFEGLFIEINTVDELIEVLNKAKHPIIISKENDKDCFEIQIYDDWL